MEGPSRKQLVIIALGMVLTLCAGVALEGGLTAENALAWAKWKEARLNAPSSGHILYNRRDQPTAANAIASDSARIADFEKLHEPEMLASAYLNRAVAYIHQREPRLAEQDLTRAASLKADTYTRRLVLEERATIYAGCDRDYAGALADLDAARGLGGRPPAPEDVLADSTLRLPIYNAMGLYGLTMSTANKALMIMPQLFAQHDQRGGLAYRLVDRSTARLKAMVLLQRGYCEGRSGDAAAALSDYNEAIALEPSAFAFDSRGALNFHQGNFGAALADYWHGWKLGRPHHDSCSR